MSKIKLPKWWSMESTLKSVMEGECSCRQIQDTESLKSQLLRLAEREFQPEDLVKELQDIIYGIENTKEACHAYIVIVEFLRVILVPKCEKDQTADKISKREDFIALLDRSISFKR